MEMHQIRYFVAVAEELHFGRAANRENVSQPPLSLQIKKLEEELGVALFERTKRRVSITEAGLAFLPQARAVLAALVEGREAALKAFRGETGLVTVGFVHSASVSCIPSLIGPFRRAFPGIEIEFREMAVSEQIDALMSGTIDLGIVRPPVREPAISSFTLVRENFCIAVPLGHRLAGRKSVDLAELDQESFVFYPRHRSPEFYRQLVNMCASAGFTPNVAVEANTMFTAVGLVGTGAGIAIVPQCIAVLGIPSVAYINLNTGSEKAELCIAYHDGRISRSAQSILNFAKNASRASSG